MFTPEIIQGLISSISKLIMIPISIYITKEFVKVYFKRKSIKEEKYIDLLDSIESFYKGTQQEEGNEKKKRDFLKQLRHCIMYAPDEVVNNGQEFLQAIVEAKSNMTEEEIYYLENKYSNFLLSIRRDMVWRTKVKEFKSYGTK